MCAKCEDQATRLLADPEKTGRFVAGVSSDALGMAAAMIHAGMRFAQDNKMGTHIGAFAMHAVCAVVAEQFRATFAPQTAEVVGRIREQVAKRLVVAFDDTPGAPDLLTFEVPLSPEKH